MKTRTWREKHLEGCDYSLRKLLTLARMMAVEMETHAWLWQDVGCEMEDLELQRSYVAKVGWETVTLHITLGPTLAAVPRFSTLTWPSTVVPWGCALIGDMAVLVASR